MGEVALLIMVRWWWRVGLGSVITLDHVGVVVVVWAGPSNDLGHEFELGVGGVGVVA